MTSRSLAAWAARRVYRILLRLHPIGRSGYASQMLATFDAMVEGAGRRGGLALAALVARESLGLVVGACRARPVASSDVVSRGRQNTMGNLRQDLRYALRSFAGQPGLTAALVATLTLGIGANSAIFSVTKAVLFPVLPFADPARLVMVWEDLSSLGFPRNTPAPGNYADWTTSIPAFEGVAALAEREFNLTGTGDPEKIGGAGVTDNLFSVLGVRPALGRIWRPDEGGAGAHVAVLSHDLWMSRFGGDRSVLDRPVSFNGIPYQVLGVMPPHFQILGPDLQIWVPIGLTAAQLTERGSHYLSVVARLRPTATLVQANVQLKTLATRLQQEQPGTNRTTGMYAVPLLDDYVGDTRTALVVLLAAAGCVLLIACANVANLLLTRATGRAREMMIRAALGADRKRLIRQLMTESLLLAGVGAALGLLVATASFGTLAHLIPLPLSGLSDVTMDLSVLGATAGAAVVTGILFGLAPAWRASQVNLAGAASHRAPRSLAGGHARLRSALVVGEIALATVLLVGAGLLVTSFRTIRGVDLGFRPDGVLTLRLQLPRRSYADFDKRAQLVDTILERVRAVPGVVTAGFTSAVPLVWKGGTAGFEPQGRALDPSLPYDANNRVVSPGYMETMGMTLRAGRFFGSEDDANGNPAAIVNERMARQYWPGQDPIGRTFRVVGPSTPWRTIVGVVADTRVMGIDQPTRAEMYFPIAQARENWMWPRDVALRASRDPKLLVADVARAIWAVDRNQPISDVALMDDIIARELQDRRLQTTLMATFAGLALLLAAVGIYGVLAFSVAERTAEIGLRLALGGQPARIKALFVRQGLVLATVGLSLGLAVAVWSTALLGKLLFGVHPRDPVTFVSQSVFLVAVCVVATYLPARRASRVDPIEALRQD